MKNNEFMPILLEDRLYAHFKIKNVKHTVANSLFTLFAVLTFAVTLTIFASSHTSSKFIAHYPSYGSSCKSNYYLATSGDCVHNPDTNPAGATAQCRDGLYTYSEHHSGSCSREGGVSRWMN